MQYLANSPDTVRLSVWQSVIDRRQRIIIAVCTKPARVPRNWNISHCGGTGIWVVSNPEPSDERIQYKNKIENVVEYMLPKRC